MVTARQKAYFTTPRAHILIEVLNGATFDDAYKNVRETSGPLDKYEFEYWYYRFRTGKYDLDYDRSQDTAHRYNTRKAFPCLRSIIDCRKIQGGTYTFVSHNSTADLYMDNGSKIFGTLENGRIIYSKFSIIPESENSLLSAMKELIFAMRQPKLELEKLNIGYEHENDEYRAICTKYLKNAMKTLNNQIQVKHVCFGTQNLEPVLTVLSSLKPGYLEEIKIEEQEEIRKIEKKVRMVAYEDPWVEAEYFINSQSEQGYIKMEEPEEIQKRNQLFITKLVQTEQWKQAKTVILEGLSFDMIPMEHFLHLKKFQIKVNTFTKEHMEQVRDILLTSPSLESCEFKTKEFFPLKDISLLMSVFPEIAETHDAYDYPENIHAVPGKHGTFHVKFKPYNSFCNPSTPTTLVFAYSNDFDADLVNSFWNAFDINNVSPHYVMFGNIRFDVRNRDDFVFHESIQGLNASIMAHQPDPALGFGNRNTGSDVLDMIDRYLNIKSVPICGSKLIIFVKRYPNETDITQLVLKLRQYHVTFTIFASYEPSGGSHPETLNTLASKVNGFCGFENDSKLVHVVYNIPTVYSPYLVYTANPQCSDGQVLALPVMNIHVSDSYWVAVTIQDSGPMSVVNTVLYQWGETQMGLLNGLPIGNLFGNQVGSWQDILDSPYNVSLTCEYRDTKSRQLQMQVFSHNYVPADWMPYDD